MDNRTGFLPGWHFAGRASRLQRADLLSKQRITSSVEERWCEVAPVGQDDRDLYGKGPDIEQVLTFSSAAPMAGKFDQSHLARRLHIPVLVLPSRCHLPTGSVSIERGGQESV